MFRNLISIILFSAIASFNIACSDEYDSAACKRETIKWPTQHPVITLDNSHAHGLAKNVILLIVDGMGLAHVQAALTANSGQLNMTNMPISGLMQTYSATDYVTDSGAGGTAIACGTKTYNRAIGVGADSLPVRSIREALEEVGYNSGVISTSSITHATPASFSVHNVSRYNYEEIAAGFMEAGLEFFAGGGYYNFDKRKDGRKLTSELETLGYTIVTKEKDLAKADGDKIAALMAAEHLPKYNKRGNFLPNAASKGIDFLASKGAPFFLMVEASQVDWGGHKNNIDYITGEMMDADLALGRILEFAKRDTNTLVIVTADHETGGLAITDGCQKNSIIRAAFTTDGHSGIMVPVFAYGPGSVLFTGMYENSSIYSKILKATGILKTGDNSPARQDSK